VISRGAIRRGTGENRLAGASHARHDTRVAIISAAMAYCQFWESNNVTAICSAGSCIQRFRAAVMKPDHLPKLVVTIIVLTALLIWRVADRARPLDCGPCPTDLSASSRKPVP
jgi:hypothetical protein